MFEHNSTFHFNNSLIYKETIFKSKDYTYVMYLRMWDKIRTKGYEACSASLVTELFLLTAGLYCFGYTVYDIEVSIIELHFNCICLHILSFTKTF